MANTHINVSVIYAEEAGKREAINLGCLAFCKHNLQHQI